MMAYHQIAQERVLLAVSFARAQWGRLAALMADQPPVPAWAARKNLPEITHVIRSLRTAGAMRPVQRAAGLGLRCAGAALGLGLAATFIGLGLDLMDEAGRAPDAGSPVDAQHTASIAAPPRLDDNWSRVVKPIAIFGLSAPDVAGLPQRYEAMRNGGGAREDRLNFGEFGGVRRMGDAGPALMPHVFLSLRRSEAPEPLSRAFFIDLVRRASDLGVSVEKTQQVGPLPTKFGPFEVADATLVQGAVERACLAFRHMSGEGALQISGWWCPAEGKPADRRQLSCLINRVDLLSAGEDKALRAIFTAAERLRDRNCATAPYASPGRKTSWLDTDGAAPKLRDNAKSHPVRSGG